MSRGGETILSIESLTGGGYLTVAVLIVAALLFALAQRERTRVLVAAGIFMASALGHALAAHIASEWAATLLRGLAVLLQGMAILNLTGIAVFRVAAPAIGLVSPQILQDVSMAVAYLLWIFLLLRVLGWDPTTVIATSAVITAVIAFSLQDTLGNILGGLSLQTEKSLHVGDWIKIGDISGQVKQMRWRYTAVETRNWETAIIPNSALLKGSFLVLGRRQGQPVKWRSWVWFNVDYRYAPVRVIETVETALRSADIPDVAREPAPNCVHMEFADSYARYAVRYWLTDLSADSPTDSAVRSHIYFALSRAGITPSIPAAAVFVTQETVERRAMKMEQAIADKSEAIRRVDIFSHLQPDELAKLAERLIPTPFARGDVMTRQGAEAHWLYIIIDGYADVVVQNGQQSTKVAESGPNSFLGEWGLLTGAPRQATVIARTDVNCYRLDKESLQDIIRARPAMAEEFSAVLARRHDELEAALEHLDTQARAARLAKSERDILGKIRHLFGLGNQGS